MTSASQPTPMCSNMACFSFVQHEGDECARCIEERTRRDAYENDETARQYGLSFSSDGFPYEMHGGHSHFCPICNLYVPCEERCNIEPDLSNVGVYRGPATSCDACRPLRRIYVASRASLPARGEMWRRYRSEGVPIISSWIDEDGPGQTADMSDLWSRVVREVTSADRLVLYVEPDDFPLKGALIEVGIALGSAVPVYVVVPGVEFDASYRPIGSWIKHPLVTRVETVEEAFRA